MVNSDNYTLLKMLYKCSVSKWVVTYEINSLTNNV